MNDIFSALRRSGIKGILTAGALAGLFAGCAVGPDFRRPDAPLVTEYTRAPLLSTPSSTVPGGSIQEFIPGVSVESKWWMSFGSASLNQLIEDGLKNSPNLGAARATLRQAQELVSAQRATLFPSISLNYSASRQKNPVGTISPTLGTGDPLYTLHTAQLTVGYLPDVFGGNRRLIESLEAQAEVQAHQLLAVQLTLSANLVVAALQESALRKAVEASKQIVSLGTQSLQLLRRQAELGYASALDVAAQETALAQVELALPPLEKQLEQTRDLLALLEGRPPAQGVATVFDIDDLQLPSKLPISLPSTLVTNRPDVRAAEAQVHSASAQVGVSVANRLPQFAILGSYGGTATAFRQMFADGNVFWGIVGSVTQPIFDFGNLLHLNRAARAALEASIAQYKNAVLTAFANVADSLYAIEADSKLLAAAANAEAAATKSFELSKRQLELGFVNSLVQINAEQALYQTRLVRIQAQAARFADTVALYQALGGGLEPAGEK